MRESRLGRWVARISVTLGLGVAVIGGVAVLSADPAGAASAPATLGPASNTSLGSTSTFTGNSTVTIYQTENEIIWW